MRVGKFIIIGLLLLAGLAFAQQRMIIVVPANRAAVANAACRRWHTNFWGIPRGTNAMVFDAALSATGTGTISHYWCNWQFTSNEWWWFTNRLTVHTTPQIRLFNAATVTPNQVLIQLELKPYSTNGP